MALGLGVVVTCAALPWVAPQVPALLAEAAPASGPTSQSQPLPLPAPTLTVAPAPPVGEVDGVDDRRLAAAGAPIEVVVRRLGVRSPVVPISGQSGELLPPDDPRVLGWWQEGARAGQAAGSVVVTGHTVSTGGGAFDRLGTLRPGDEIQVRTRAGRIDYRVRASRDVPVAELARSAASIFRQAGLPRLVLITCSDFDGKVYRSNAIVYADPVTSGAGPASPSTAAARSPGRPRAG